MALTDLIEGFLASLNIQPASYAFMFPPEIESAKILQMVNDKVFPTVTGLAPALTYALLLSLARYILHFILFKVCYFCCFAASFELFPYHFFQPLALRSMKLKDIKFVNIPEIDKVISMKTKTVDVS